ncbi:ankyrin repeat and LEM domain-containing protein 1 [Phlebotomus argentipes]|uniref:ankyrin repeat and LEM domain-containing protein 1 n=1 Tax=Phlebotomus argentipes TaxID=94469 RepID=UPI002892ECF9|nr:ankyrin repeat and LEM domain-containing protein 1 [Phlebotomus argentipes]
MAMREKALQCLGLCLIDELDDENLITLRYLLENRQADPNVIVKSKQYAAVHFLASLENRDFADAAANMIFGEFGGDPNVKALLCGVTPMHIAAGNGYEKLFALLLEKGGDLEIVDDDGRCPLAYALEENRQEIISLAHDHILKLKRQKKQSEMCLSPAIAGRMGVTPDGTPVNFNTASPYYIHITHRRKTPHSGTGCSRDQLQLPEEKENIYSTPKKVNLFDLTKENLEQHSKCFSSNGEDRQSKIAVWREKVSSSRSRQSFTRCIEEMEKMLSQFSDLDTTSECSDRGSRSQFYTAHETENDSYDVRRSPRLSQNSVLYMVEIYQHEDPENNVQFFERKFGVPGSSCGEDAAETTLSTMLKIPSEYETDALREELTTLGHPPGPITNTTKRMYLKRLMSFRKHPERVALVANGQKSQLKFSVELINCLQMENLNRHLTEYLKLEREMIQSFQDPSKKWREGHLKTSFIYLLIDPRVSANLPSRTSSLSPDEVWQIFLQSIFYVGKGKNSRPYAHLYEAIKHFGEFYMSDPLAKTAERRLQNQKITKIMDIWNCDLGVVCLHVFHNVLPVEAYSREAALIDCLGLQHLTNHKRGDYYGASSCWNMRQKKHMAIGLLFKALQVYLAEGESQLTPKDLL